MRLVLLAAVVVAAACTGSDPDLTATGTSPIADGGALDGSAADDGGASTGACDPARDFGAPTDGPFARVNDGARIQEGASLSPDELTLYYATNTGVGGGLVAFDLWRATRRSLAEPFDGAEPLPKFDSKTTSDRNPVFAPNGRLFFARLQLDATYQIMWTESQSDGTWSAPHRLTQFSQSSSTFPSYYGISGKLWYWSADGVHAGPVDEDGGTTMSTMFFDLSSDADPVPSADEKTMYYAVKNAGTGLDVRRVGKQTNGQWTVDPIELTSVNTEADDAPRAISRDGCRLYLTVSTSGSTAEPPRSGKLQMAERGK